jgi:hypothetical protein
MQDSKDYLVLQQLLDDLKDKYNDGNRIEVAQFKIGEYMWEDMKIKPAISFQGDVIEIDTEHKIMGGHYYKRLMITLDMFMDNQPTLEIHDDIYKLKDEVTQFLRSTDWTFRADTAFGDTSIVYIGGPSDPVKQARITFSVIYRD